MKFAMHDSVIDASTHAHTLLIHFVIETNRIIINSAKKEVNLISSGNALIHSRRKVLPFLPSDSHTCMQIACTRILLV